MNKSKRIKFNNRDFENTAWPFLKLGIEGANTNEFTVFAILLGVYGCSGMNFKLSPSIYVYKIKSSKNYQNEHIIFGEVIKMNI